MRRGFLVLLALGFFGCGKRVPRCTELAASYAARDAEFVPLRKAACTAAKTGDEAGLKAAYKEMFEKSAAMLAEFPKEQECRTADGASDTYDLPSRGTAEKLVDLGVDESFLRLREQILSACVL